MKAEWLCKVLLVVVVVVVVLGVGAVSFHKFTMR